MLEAIRGLEQSGNRLGGHGEYRGRDDGRGPGKRLVTTAKGLVRVRDE